MHFLTSAAGLLHICGSFSSVSQNQSTYLNILLLNLTKGAVVFANESSGQKTNSQSLFYKKEKRNAHQSEKCGLTNK